MAPDNQNPYDFIFQDRPKAKRSVLPNGNSKQSRMLIVVGGLLGLIFLFIILFAVLSGAGKGSSQALLTAAQDQSEVLRVATAASQKAQGRDAKSLAITTQLAMTTDQSTLLATLAKLGSKPAAKDLGSSSAGTDDNTLNNAAQAGQYDTAFTTIIKQLLNQYQHDLLLASASAGSTTRNTINELSAHVTTILSSK